MPREPDLRPNAVDYIAPTLRYGQAMHDGQPPLPSLRREVRTSVRTEPAAGMFALAALGLMFASTGATLLMRANSAPRFTDRGSVGTWFKATSVQPAAVAVPAACGAAVYRATATTPEATYEACAAAMGSPTTR